MVINNYFLTSQISQLTTGFIQEITNPNKHTIKEYEHILKNPWARACCNIKALRAINMMGDYKHNNEEINDFINDNFQNMNGKLATIVGILCNSMPLGTMVAEIGFKKKKKFRKVEYRLDGFNILDPNRVKFGGHWGNLTHVVYYDGKANVWLPYEKCVHITNGFVGIYNERSAYGNPEAEVAYPYVQLYNLIMSEMSISAKTLATGFLVGQANSDDTVQLYDANGKIINDPRTGQPYKINAVQHLAQQLESIENHNHIVTDLKNKLSNLSVAGGEAFWQIARTILREDIMAAFITPSMILSEGSGAMGVATLSVKHMTVLDSTVESIVKQIQDQLIQKVVRPLIIWNFGIQKSYGEFTIEPTTDPSQDNITIQSLITAISSGILSASDLSALNALRSKLDLPLMSEEKQQQLQLMQQLQSQQPDDGQQYP